MSWHTLFLVGAGNVLGKAIDSSGLLGYIADAITVGKLPLWFQSLCLSHLLRNPQCATALPSSSPWLALIFVLFVCCVIATFISHTVASLILMPIITTIGRQFGVAEPMLIGAAFAGESNLEC